MRSQPVEIIARALHSYEDQIVKATPERPWDYLQPRERQQYLDRAQAALDGLRDERFAVVDATPHGEACRVTPSDFVASEVSSDAEPTS